MSTDRWKMAYEMTATTELDEREAYSILRDLLPNEGDDE